MKTIDFYYSIGSRYSYLASTQIETLEQEFNCQVLWHPVNSVKLIEQREKSHFKGKPVSGQYEWKYRELDAKRWAELYDVPYQEPRGKVIFDSEFLALACTTAKYFDKTKEYSHLLFRAMFENSLSRIDEKECIACAETCGISKSDFKRRLTAKETANQLNKTINLALNLGVFGVPTFMVSGELFWGNDRVILLRHYLKKQVL